MDAPRSDCRATIRRFKLAAVLLLGACATLEQDLAPAKASWQGATYEEVAKQWGAPARSNPPAYTWVSESTRRVAPSVGIGIGIGGGSGVGGVFGSLPFGNTGEPVRCSRTLTFRDGVVTEQSWLGPPDYCSGFSR